MPETKGEEFRRGGRAGCQGLPKLRSHLPAGADHTGIAQLQLLVRQGVLD